jgi:Ca2+-binding RTX toxin-like protein
MRRIRLIHTASSFPSLAPANARRLGGTREPGARPDPLSVLVRSRDPADSCAAPVRGISGGAQAAHDERDGFGSRIREATISLRFLLAGLTFFATALVVAALPVVAQGHRPVNVWSKPCTIVGTAGPDLIRGTPRADVICGLGGADTLAGNSGADIVRGGRGADVIQGDSGQDVLLGGEGKDILYSYDGTHDHIDGGGGFDRLPRHDRLLDRRSGVESLD